MEKRVYKKFGSLFYDKLSKTIRSKRDLILVLLDSLKLFYLDDLMKDGEEDGTMLIIVDKMSRVFYQLKDKSFSIAFPFSLDILEKEIHIFDPVLDVEMDSRMVALLLGILKDWDGNALSVEQMYDDFCVDLFQENDYTAVNNAWKIITRLIITELGYIRYDRDVKHEKGDMHPLNHFDVNYSSNCTWKMGLKEAVKLDEFADILNVKTKCRYLI